MTAAARSIAGVLIAAGLQAPAFRARVDLVAVAVTVTDAGGRAVSGLSREAFTVAGDGKFHRIRITAKNCDCRVRARSGFVDDAK